MRCETPFGGFSFQRWPKLPKDQLQAWDKADLLLLDYVKSRNVAVPTLVLNDRFGALATALQEHGVTSWSDSWISQRALRENLELNGRAEVDFVSGELVPQGQWQLVVARVPKSLHHWRAQLIALRALLAPGAGVLIAGGMSKHLPHRAYQLMEECLGPAVRHRAVGKARLLSASLDSELNPPRKAQASCHFQGREFVNLANVFSQGKVDLGSALLLSTFPGGQDELRILDLACGNGLLGVSLQCRYPRAELSYIDESYQAVASARRNHGANCQRPAVFRVADGLSDYEGEKFGLIVLNPPFHQGHEVSDSTAWRLIQQSRAHLLEGGELRVVGNRNLAYHAKLKRLFGNCRLLKSDAKFTVVSAIR